jgi:hypothetical protein
MVGGIGVSGEGEGRQEREREIRAGVVGTGATISRLVGSRPPRTCSLASNPVTMNIVFASSMASAAALRRARWDLRRRPALSLVDADLKFVVRKLVESRRARSAKSS